MTTGILSVPNAAIDFNALHDNLMAGKADAFEGAIIADPAPAAEDAVSTDASAEVAEAVAVEPTPKKRS